jgi:TonB-linked SusC/RagA family outer membrane protein
MIRYLNKKSKTPIGSLLRTGLVFFCFAFVSMTAYSQTQVKGLVTDAKTSEPLPGVSVLIEGTTSGAITNIDGQYTITVPAASSVLVFSFMGYNSEKVAVEGKSEINVSLIADIKTLDEVVVIGYGTVKKRDLTGPVSTISGDKLADIPVTSVAEALTGKLAGVQVTTTEGSPDAEIDIRVRGGGSITQDNSPLYIVDGFPVDKISDIPPTDIQSVDVLKDASTTAIYGARGANGVIIITTKSAKQGKLTVSYNGYYGVKNVTKKLGVLSPYEFAKWQYEQAVLQNVEASQYEAYFGSYNDIGLYKDMRGNDWQDIVFGRTGTTQNHNITVSSGNETMNFRATYSRADDKAIMLGSSFSRDNLNLMLNSTPVKWMKADFSVRYSDTKIYGGGANDMTGTEKSTSDSRLKNSVIYTPIPLKNYTSPDIDPESASSLYPPTTTIPDNDRFQHRKYYNLGANITVNFYKWLSFRSEIGMDFTNDIDDRFYGLSTYYVTGGDAPIKNQPAAQLINENSSSFRNANVFTSTFKIKEHNFSIMAGEETLEKKDNTLTNINYDYPTQFTSNMAWSFTSLGLPYSSNNYFTPDDNLLSFFGRLNYDYKGKYLVTSTMRADGSSKFGPAYRWGYFPSAAVAWRLSEENFLEGTKSWLSNLKLRASYGEAGNNRIPPLSFLTIYTPQTTSYIPTSLGQSILSTGSRMANPDLHWETEITSNVGLDIGILNNRINSSVELYYNIGKGLLLDMYTPGVGYQTQLQNIGKTLNKGIEVTLDAALIDKKDFKLNFSFNIAFNRNTIQSIGGPSSQTYSSTWTSDAQASSDYIAIVGKPMGEMYGYKTLGMYSVNDFTWNGSSWVLNNANAQTPDNSAIDGPSWGPGALKLRDQNGDGQITSSDKIVIGNANPKHTGGFAFTAQYKGFDMTANFNWVYGNNIYNANKIEFTTANKYKYRNMLDIMNSSNRWVNIDPATGNRVTDPAQLEALNANAKIWSPGMSRFVFHSWAVEDGSFLRLNNLTLGYTLPSKWMSKLYVKQLRFYVSAYNLFVWTKYSGYDPEVDTRRSTPLTPGVDYAAYPKSRSYNFGVNLTF